MFLRPAQPEEYAAVGVLTLGAYVADGHLTDDAAYAEELRGAAHRATAASLVVAVDPSTDRLLGTVTYCVAGSPYAEIATTGEAELRMLAVRPEARGQGLGVALTRWCIDRAREQGHRALVLSSLDRMTTAHRLYERLGFGRLPERDWQPGPGIRLLAYGLPLED